MKVMSKRSFRKRGLAFIMALLMIVPVFPSAGITVNAQTDKHQGFVTITVTDAEGAAINGATVTYTIKEKENGTNNFQTIAQSGETDSYGTVEVLEASKYYDDLTITASISKEGYTTDTTTINKVDVTSDTQDFHVTLTAESQPGSLPDIKGVSVDVLNADYNGEAQNLVSVITETEDVTIEYSSDGNIWADTCPSETNAGEYAVYVRITKDGYNTYLSGKQTAKINKVDITGIDITAKEVEYKDETEQELISMTGAFDENDTVIWYINSKSTGSRDIPKQLAVGEYTVKLVVQRDNYNDFEKTVTAKILNAKINLGNLKVTGLDGIYNGKAQDAVKVENQGDYTLYYQLDDGSQTAKPDAWDITIPKVTNAGSYIVWVKATKQYYDDKNVDVIKAENAVAPYNAYFAKASQEFSFDTYAGDETCVEITQAEMEAGKEFNFAATDKEKKAGGTITYSVALDEGDDGIATIDSQTGILFVKGAGKITIKAVLSGNDNYNECTLEHVLYVKGKSTAGAWISFPENTVEYILGNSSGITANVAVKKAAKDKGAITYSIDNGTELGISINSNSGMVSVDDYNKLVEAIENNKGILNVTVKADKAEYSKRGWWSKANYPADSISYTLKISMTDAPASAYKIYAADDLETELTNPNGENNWYNTTLVVKPADGYSIIRADELTKDKPSFKDSVKFGEMVETEAKDQGASLSHYIYLEETATGNITKKVEVSNLKLDTVAPYNVNIDFPNVEEKDSVKYYGDYITVTFTAYDATSGVNHFDWKYKRENGASNSNLESDNGIVNAQVDKDNPNKYTATLTLPRNEAEQLRGNLQVTAIDKAGNSSISCTDGGVFVIDTITPTQKVEYKLKNNEGSNQIVGEKHYFSNDVEFTFKIVEANFYSEDVTITVSKNNGSDEKQSVTWTDTENSDEHQATLTLSDDAEYTVSVTYEDRSGKKMTAYTSETIVVDKTVPAIEFDFKDYKNSQNPQSATVKITERNFRTDDLKLDVSAKNINGNTVSTNDLQQYLRSCEWITEDDVHTAIIDKQFVDGIYELTFNYTDLALNQASEVKSSSFIVDRSAPNTADMSIKYSNPIMQTILSSITFGYYNPNVDVTFTAHDSISGVKEFTWSYLKETGASDSNVAEYAETKVTAMQDSTDKSKYTATVTLPKSVADQIRGTVSFAATDNYDNSSNKLTDTNNVLVVDTIAPAISVEYLAADNSYNGKDYYKQDLTATFTITEANFYNEDVKVKVKKNDDSYTDLSPVWTDTNADVHIGRVTIPAESDHSNDGDYTFSVEYNDRSNNQMNTYISTTKVIDTTKPVIEVRYANENPVNTMMDVENHQRKYFSSTQTATITVKEHNFNEAAAKYTIVTKDVAGNEINASGLYSVSAWTENGDDNILTITYPGDANYTFDIECTDLATLQADDYVEEYFTVDTSKPTDLNVSYSNSILDTILDTVTFGFYNAETTVTVTATDNISGINSMKYSYVKADGVSAVNTELVDAIVDASSITNSNGGATGTVAFEVPREVLDANNQFNGTINFTATDRANNESDYLRDAKRIIVDNISPTAEVQYSTPVQTSNGIAYYDGDISATVTIYEANFYPEDVQITVTKNGAASTVNANWTENGMDVHTGTFTISGDGDYTVGITYTDKSSNTMQAYTSEQMTIDTEITEAAITINGQDADGKAFKDEVVPAVSFNDTNFESCEVKMFRTSYADKNVDVTDKFITGHISTNEAGGNGEFNTFDKLAENDGIYTITTSLKDKAGHSVDKSITFTVNRFGSVYEYNDLLVSLIGDGGAYVPSVDDDLVITEYNADRLVADSLDIEILRDGKPLDNTDYSVSPEINETVATGSSGWYQYSYTIARDNFVSDGVYKIAVSSKDATGNSPENNNYDDKSILFRVDSTAPEITSVTGLENSIVNATEQTVKYTVYDTIGLASVEVYVDDKETDNITDFSADANNYDGAFVLKESSNAQNVRFVVTDKAGNVTDTNSDGFTSSYVFNNTVTISTNIFVRWFANKALFYGSIAGAVAVIGGGAGVTVFFRKRKFKAAK